MSANRRQILFVDDDEDLVNTAADALGQAGYDVVSARNGKQALALLERQSVDLLVTDVVMPEMDGLELIRELRRRGERLLILAASGDADGNLLRIASFLGANATLRKPYSGDELCQAVVNLLQPR